MPAALTPKVRLGSDSRQSILAYAATVIDCPVEREAELFAHSNLLLQLRLRLTELVPDADLAVLRQYKATMQVTSAMFIRGEDAAIPFCFCPRDVRAAPPRNSNVYRRRTGCHVDGAKCNVHLEIPRSYTNNFEHGWAWQLTHVPSTELREPLNLWLEAVNAHDLARRTILDALRTVVYNARSLQDVINVWAPAANLFEEMGGVPAVTDETKALLASATFAPPPKPAPAEDDGMKFYLHPPDVVDNNRDDAPGAPVPVGYL